MDKRSRASNPLLLRLKDDPARPRSHRGRSPSALHFSALFLSNCFFTGSLPFLGWFQIVQRLNPRDSQRGFYCEGVTGTATYLSPLLVTSAVINEKNVGQWVSFNCLQRSNKTVINQLLKTDLFIKTTACLTKT